jgi:hypothetical protein
MESLGNESSPGLSVLRAERDDAFEAELAGVGEPSNATATFSGEEK